MNLQMFMLKKIPKVNFNPTCLAVTSLDSSLKKDGNYYPQVFLKECSYIEKKVIRNINIILVTFLLLMSLMKNKLDWVQFFGKSIYLQNLIR